MWTLAENEEVSGGHPHYEHRTPNGQVVHLFHVNSAYGGAPRWVIGPVPGNENGWGFVDTSASHPEIIAEKWMVWMETSWEESKRLCFRGLERGTSSDWTHFIEEEEQEEEDDEEGEEEEGGRQGGSLEKKTKKKMKKNGAKKQAATKGKAAKSGSASGTSGARPKAKGKKKPT